MPPGQPLISEPVSRLSFQRVVHSAGERGKWVFAHSADPSTDSSLTHNVLLEERNVRAARRFHASNSGFSGKDGPYSDRDGLVCGLASRLAERISSEDELLVRTMALTNERGIFEFDSSLILDEGLFSAGLLLANPKRVCRAHGEDSLPIRFAHDMEPYLLATALLRASGLQAYPALAITHPAHEEAEPVMAVLSKGPVPLKTFSLSGAHPPMCELELLGDMAALGLRHAMMAENLTKRLALDILSGALSGHPHPEDDIEASVQELCRELHMCHRHWPDSVFIQRAITRLGAEVEQNLCVAAGKTFAGSGRMSLMATWAGVLAEGLKDLARQTLEGLKAQSMTFAN